jgi:hypothetical protein
MDVRHRRGQQRRAQVRAFRPDRLDLVVRLPLGDLATIEIAQELADGLP